MLEKLEMTFYTVSLIVQDRVENIRRRDRESGAVTLEQALWAVGIIVIATAAFAVIKAFVTKNTNNIEKTGVLK